MVAPHGRAVDRTSPERPRRLLRLPRTSGSRRYTRRGQRGDADQRASAGGGKGTVGPAGIRYAYRVKVTNGVGLGQRSSYVNVDP